LHEIYFPAFKAAVQEGGVWAIMGAYNRINGPYCCASPYLLTNAAKNLWGFQGLIMSDWGAVHDTIPTLNAGLDLEMPTGFNLNKDAVIAAVKSGAVKESLLDDKVRRMIRAMMSMGFFEHDKNDKGSLDTPEHREVALKTAIESAVLLKNDGILPLDRTKIRSIAVLGPNSTIGRTGGGGSSYVEPLYAVSPLEGIQKKLGKSVDIRSAIGVALDEKTETIGSEFLSPPNGKAGEGLLGEYFNNDKFEGKPVLTRIDKQINFHWGTDAPATEIHQDYFSIRWTGSLIPKETGLYSLVIGSDDGSRIYVGGKLLVDNWGKHGILYREGQIELTAGKAYPIVIEFYEDVGGADMVLGWELKPRNPLNEAVEAARNADAAVIFAGVTNQYESEGLDRNNLRLPGGQDELIEAVAKVTPNTIVVLNAGASLAMDPWLDQVKAVAHVWFPGEEGGNAIAELLFGDANFSGKLPTTFVKQWEDSPAYANYPGKNGEVDYAEGVFVGYRYFDSKNVEPLFPFGYGLSYTQFKYGDLEIAPKVADKNVVSVKCTIQNVGSRAGAEVAQLYVGDVEASVERPVKELKGFARVELAPGEKKTVTFPVDEAALSFYDAATHGWKAEPGLFKVFIGSSSRDIRLEGQFELK
jgi:beta-glucosidase